MNYTLENHQKSYNFHAKDAFVSLLTGLSGTPYAKRHLQQAKSSHSLGHRTIAVLEFIPLIGGLAALLERIAVLVYSRFIASKQEETETSPSLEKRGTSTTQNKSFDALVGLLKERKIRLERWKKRTEERKGTPLQASIRGGIHNEVSEGLAKLATYNENEDASGTIFRLSLFCKSPLLQTLKLHFRYNSRIDKFAVCLIGMPPPDKENEANILEYTVTNLNTQTTKTMKQQMLDLKDGPYKVISTQAFGDLHQCEDEEAEFLLKECPPSSEESAPKNPSSAWLVNYGADYTITFPKEYNLPPFTLKLAF